MDWNSSPVLSILEIIGTNLVLSGDSAVLVAMAAHHLPPHQRRIALILGICGAIVLQILATLAVARLLHIPLLLCVGGVLLCGIALKLLREEEEEGSPGEHVVKSLGHAVWTILMANLIMSLDNVLAVASVGHGHPNLIVFGLLLSILLLISGSLFIAELMNKYPLVVTLGAGILAWTAGSMIGSDPVIQRVAWAQLGTDLQQRPFPFLLSAATTMMVMGVSNWRK